MKNSNSSGDSGQDRFPTEEGYSGIINSIIGWYKNRDHEEAHTLSRMSPCMLMAHYAPEVSNGAVALKDGGSFIPTSEEFWTLVDMAARFYQQVDDDRIRLHNLQLHQQREAYFAKPASPKLPAKPKPGYVYVLEGQGVYKIGRSVDPERRSEQLAVQLPYEVRLIVTVHSEDYRALEQDLHERFSGQRANGEWFYLEDEDIKYIRGLQNDA